MDILKSMAASTDVLISEVNKIYKKELIIWIVHGTVPSSVIISDIVSDFFYILGLLKERSAKEDQNFSHDTSNEIIANCKKRICKHWVQNDFYRTKIDLLKTTVHHLECRINDQEVIINVLQKN